MNCLSGPANAQYVHAALRALAHGDTAGWTTYVAGDLHADQHMLHVGTNVGGRIRRVLIRDEAQPYMLGVAAAHGRPHEIADLVTAKPPATLTLDQAEEVTGLSRDGVNYRIRNGDYYPMFITTEGGRAARVYYRDQMRNPNGAAWRKIRAQLPVRTRFQDLPVYTEPADVPLVVNSRAAGRIRARTLLQVGHDEGWFVFVSSDPNEDRYVVRVQAGPLGDDGTAPVDTITLDAATTLPFVLGIADVYQAAHLVAYRPGLGQ